MLAFVFVVFFRGARAFLLALLLCVRVVLRRVLLVRFGAFFTARFADVFLRGAFFTAFLRALVVRVRARAPFFGVLRRVVFLAILRLVAMLMYTMKYRRVSRRWVSYSCGSAG